jgi:hypothetical protein
MEDAGMSRPGIRPGAYRAIMDAASESLYCSHKANLAINKAMYSIERSSFLASNPNRNKTLSSMEIARRIFINLAASPSQAIVEMAIEIAKYTKTAYGISNLDDMLADQYVSMPEPILIVMQGLGLFAESETTGPEAGRWKDIPDSLDEIAVSPISGTSMTWDWIGSIGISG